MRGAWGGGELGGWGDGGSNGDGGEGVLRKFKRGVLGEWGARALIGGTIWMGNGLVGLGGVSKRLSMKGFLGWGEEGSLEEEWCKFGLDSYEEEVVPWVEYESLVEGVLDGALGGVGDEDVVMGDGVENLSSSLVRSIT